MSQRQQTGGTLALIAACTIIIILVGIGMFLLAQMLGGGREAQHATDAGNLNVAKKSLVSPTITPNAAELASFDGLFPLDGNNNPVVNLQTYNKFVGKSFLVAINAEAEGTAIAKTHAQTEHDLVEGDGGMGSRLWSALHDPNKTTGFFEGVAKGNSIRMLDWGGSHVGAEGGRDKVGFMRQAQGAPSNVAFFPGEIPAALATNPVVNDSTGKYVAVRTTASGLQKRYLVGYEGLPIGALNIFAVPVRPGEQPHLVSQEQFETALEPPAALGTSTKSLIPPNAFESNSSAAEMVSKGNVKMRSSAIVGTLNTDFSASIPHGYIIVDNVTNNNPPTNVPGFINDVFADALMGPGVTVGQPDHTLSKNAGDFQKLKDAAFDPATGNLTPAALATLNNPDPAIGVHMEPPTSDLNNIAKHMRNNTETTFNCSGSIPAGSPGSAFSNPCKDELQYISDNYPPDGTTTTGTNGVTDLMAVEILKAKVLEIRAAYDDIGCGDAYADGSCTGLKKWNHASQDHVPFTSDAPGTLNELLTQTNGTPFITDITQRMHQMNPEAADYTSVFSNTNIAMNTTSYLFYDPGVSKFVLKPSTPFARPDTSTGNPDSLPDGTEQELKSVIGDLNGVIINVPGESGYPNPWDCPPSSSNQGSGFNDITVIGASADKALWTPSSGFKNVLGILKFRNCAKGGGHWCCPC